MNSEITYQFVVCNVWQAFPCFTVFVAQLFIIISLMFFFLGKLLFSGFFQFKSNFVPDQFKIPRLNSLKAQVDFHGFFWSLLCFLFVSNFSVIAVSSLSLFEMFSLLCLLLRLLQSHYQAF